MQVAKKRGVPVEAVRKDDPEVEAVVVRGVEISGSSLENITTMTDDDWKVLISKPEIVFARTSPENKLTIVKQVRILLTLNETLLTILFR